MSDVTAIILAAGQGARLRDLILPGTMPKCMLPLGGRLPMITYVVSKVVTCGIGKILIVCQTALIAELTKELASQLRTTVDLQFVGVTDEQATDGATTTCIRRALPMVKTPNVLIMPCDFVTDDDRVLTAVINTKRLSDMDGNERSVVCLFVKKDSDKDGTQKAVPGDTSYVQQKKSLLAGGGNCCVATDEDTNDIVAIIPSSNQHHVIPIPTLLRHQRLAVSTDLFDTHVYCLSKSLLHQVYSDQSGDVLEKYPNFRQDLLPVLVSNTKFNVTSVKDGLAVDFEREMCTLSSKQCHLSNADDVITKGVIVDPSRNSRVYVRVNNLQTFWDVHQMFFSKTATPNMFDNIFASRDQSPSPAEQLASCAASCIHPSVRFGSKLSAKNCEIGPNVTIGDNVALSNCIIASGVTIGNDCVLKNCRVAAGMNVADGQKLTGTTVKRDEMMSFCV